MAALAHHLFRLLPCPRSSSIGKQVTSSSPRRLATIFLCCLAGCHSEAEIGPHPADDDAARIRRSAEPDEEYEEYGEHEEQAAPDSFFDVPQGDVAELDAFIDRIQQYEPVDTNDLLRYQRDAPVALVAAAKRLLALPVEPKSTTYWKSTEILLRDRIRSAGDLSGKERADQYQKWQELLRWKRARGPLGPGDIGLAQQVAQQLEQSDRLLAEEAYTTFARLAAGSEDLEIRDMAAVFSGAARRMALPGRPLSLQGHRLDGRVFSIDQLRGQAVLIDFWASWCQPCVAEHQRLKDVYRRFHRRGFEIVGVSLDVDRKALDRYVQEAKLPWITLHPGSDKGQNSAVREYGIMAIPVMILVDAQGKVVSLSARGDELERLLNRLLTSSAVPTTD